MLCWTFILVGQSDRLTAQEPNPSATAQESAELPDHAIWRYGTFGEPHRSNGFYRLEYSPTGQYLAMRNQDNVVLVLDLNQKRLLWEFNGHERLVESLDFSPDERYLITAAGSGEMVKIWDIQSGKLTSQIKTEATAAVFNRIGSRIDILGETHVETYSWPGTQLVTQRKWKTGNETAIGLSPDGRRVAMFRVLSGRVFQTLVMDLETQAKVQLPAPTGEPRSVAFSNDRNWVAVNYRRDPRTRLWDLRDPHRRQFTLEGHDNAVQSLTFSDDDRFLLTTSWDDTAILWDVLSRQPVLRVKGHTENANSSAFDPLKFQFATGASGRTDSSMILWNYRNEVLVNVDSTVQDFDELWERLGHQDYQPAIMEVSRLTSEPDRWMDSLSRKVSSETNAESSGSVAELINQLNSPRFEIREQAMLKLIKIRVQADSQLRMALESSVSPEVRFRIQRILKTEIERPPHDEIAERRWYRLNLALELIGSKASLDLLEQIAQGHRNIDISRNAAAALERSEMSSLLKRESN